MRNLRDAIFYLKMNVLQNFHTCISVPVIYLFSKYVACCAATVLPCTQLYQFFFFFEFKQLRFKSTLAQYIVFDFF